MKRLDFFKSVLGISLFTAMPTGLLSNDVKYKFNDVFIYNEKMFKGVIPMIISFNPKCEIYKSLKQSIKHRIVDKKRFRYYMPERQVYIPIKSEYQLSDFKPLMLFLTSQYNKHLYCEYWQGSFIQFTKDELDRMHVTLFVAE